MGEEGEGRRFLESYGASQPCSPHKFTATSPASLFRRHSDPLLSQHQEEPEWPVLFGATPIEEDPLPAARPRSRTLQARPPDGSFPIPVRQKNKPSMVIGQKKSKTTARRLSLPPILEADQSSETKTQPSPIFRPTPAPAPPAARTSTPSSGVSGGMHSNIYAKYFRWNRNPSAPAPSTPPAATSGSLDSDSPASLPPRRTV
jgi:hypothetical protein